MCQQTVFLLLLLFFVLLTHNPMFLQEVNVLEKRFLLGLKKRIYTWATYLGVTFISENMASTLKNP